MRRVNQSTPQNFQAPITHSDRSEELVRACGTPSGKGLFLSAESDERVYFPTSCPKVL